MPEPVCPGDFTKCDKKKCCFEDPTAGNSIVISHCDDPCFCYAQKEGENNKVEYNYDPVNGCVGGDATAICIAVIDEDDGYSPSQRNSDWNSFRNNYPDRPFYCLDPGGGGGVGLPSGWDGVYTAVNRDNGNSGSRSDWFAICNVESASRCVLFIDNSGSMTTSTVAASKAFFESKCAAAGVSVSVVENSSEQWIAPFVNSPTG